MIVNDTQYQELLQEMLKAAAPTLWKLINAPLSALTMRSGHFERMQKAARVELRRIARFEVPRRGYLEFDK